eukprot:2710471-Amphidinium_carterae.1
MHETTRNDDVAGALLKALVLCPTVGFMFPGIAGLANNGCVATTHPTKESRRDHGVPSSRHGVPS